MGKKPESKKQRKMRKGTNNRPLSTIKLYRVAGVRPPGFLLVRKVDNHNKLKNEKGGERHGRDRRDKSRRVRKP